MNPLGVEAEIIAIAVQLFESIVVRVYYQPWNDYAVQCIGRVAQPRPGADLASRDQVEV